MKSLQTITTITAALISVILCANSGANDAVPAWKTDSSLSQISLRGPFLKLLKERRNAPEKDAISPGQLSIGSVVLPVQVKVRGHSAWMDGECDFPKLTIIFDMKTTVGTPFAGLKKLKLGTHCGDITDPAKWFSEKHRVKNPVAVWREAYLYDLLRKLGIRTLTSRPTTVTYEDTGATSKSVRPAFFLDDEDEFAKRFGSKVLEFADMSEGGVKIGKGDLFSDALTLNVGGAQIAILGEIAIGNPDFLLKQTPDDDTTDGTAPLSNMYVMQALAGSAKFAVPYDFDVASAVTAHTGSETLGLTPPPGLDKYTFQIRTKIAAFKKIAPPAAYANAVNLMLARRTSVLTDIASAPIDADGKKLLQDQIAIFFQELAGTK
jgi:hypothetical protein